MVEIFISYSHFELYCFKSNDVFELKKALSLEGLIDIMSHSLKLTIMDVATLEEDIKKSSIVHNIDSLQEKKTRFFPPPAILH